MRILPFLIILICASVLSCFLLTVFLTKAEEHKIVVTAEVLEHLTYFKDGQDVQISTNYQSNYSLLDSNGKTLQSFLGPSENEFKLPVEKFILVANF